MKTLGLAFHINDRDKSGYFDFDEFEQVLARAGLFLKRQELTKLFRAFDKDKNEKINFQEFLIGLQGQLNDRRTDMIRKAFQKMDKTGDGVITLEDVLNTYDASKHPSVLKGEKTKDAVLREFVDTFKDSTNNEGKQGIVSWNDWVEYYRNVSASVVDDDYFVMVMEKAWGIKETGNDGTGVSAAAIEQVKATIREKVRQKSLSPANESNTLKTAFKHFDSDNSNTISQVEFLFALERFGVLLEEKTARALFLAFDSNNSGRINYAEFSTGLYKQGDADFDSQVETKSKSPRPVEAKTEAKANQPEVKAQPVATKVAVNNVKPANNIGSSNVKQPAGGKKA
jgi:Ca2+-binding EF-hand superfamily protein